MLKDGTSIAVEVLSATSRQGVGEFLTELTAISDIKHENLVVLLGCCTQGSRRILVYDYLENNSLQQTLLGNTLFYDYAYIYSVPSKVIILTDVLDLLLQDVGTAAFSSTGRLA
jgi:hypothetical protein